MEKINLKSQKIPVQSGLFMSGSCYVEPPRMDATKLFWNLRSYAPAHALGLTTVIFVFL